jgi:uncharacterized oxidoreductase
MNLSNNKILITGGGSGIGLGLTKEFVQEKNTVIICGRNKAQLNEVSKKYPGVITRVCDISKETEHIELFGWVKANHPDLSVLVNNAGIQNWMTILDEDFYTKTNNEIAINITAPVHLAKLFLNLQSLNTIINVTSGFAFVPLTKVPVYCSTKAFMRSFTLSLRHQLKSTGIEVIEIIPPALNTDLGGKGIHDEKPPVADFIKAVFKQLKDGKAEITFDTTVPLVAAIDKVIGDIFSKLNP